MNKISERDTFNFQFIKKNLVRKANYSEYTKTSTNTTKMSSNLSQFMKNRIERHS